MTDCDADGHATLSLRNKFAMGDEVELVGPDTRPFTMTVPLMVGDNILGLLQIDTHDPARAFTKNDLELAVAVSQQAAWSFYVHCAIIASNSVFSAN